MFVKLPIPFTCTPWCFPIWYDTVLCFLQKAWCTQFHFVNETVIFKKRFGCACLIITETELHVSTFTDITRFSNMALESTWGRRTKPGWRNARQSPHYHDMQTVTFHLSGRRPRFCRSNSQILGAFYLIYSTYLYWFSASRTGYKYVISLCDITACTLKVPDLAKD